MSVLAANEDRAEAPPVSVAVVAGCADVRGMLRSLIEGDAGLRFAGEVTPGSGAAAALERLRPAVVVLDLAPGCDGGQAVEAILDLAPTPILICSAGPDSRATVAALAAGAVGVLALPTASPAPETVAELGRRIRAARRLQVSSRPSRPGPPRPAPPEGAQEPARVVEPTPASPGAGAVRVVAVGASTGGPSALATLLGSLPESLTGNRGPAVVVVQHMADGFVAGLAEWLDGLCALPVGVARGGERLAAGRVVLAPGGGNLLVDARLRLCVEPAPPSQFHVPSIDATFASVARAVGSAAVGVLLTGMGRDGAEGLCAMRASGALTLGQDEGTCAVYGMPAAARRAGGVTEELPLSGIAPRLVAELRRGAAVRA